MKIRVEEELSYTKTYIVEIPDDTPIDKIEDAVFGIENWGAAGLDMDDDVMSTTMSLVLPDGGISEEIRSERTR
jgi:hypothetical protein